MNYNCIRCLTYALATQLVVTLDGPLSDAGMAELSALWSEIASFAQNIEDVPLSELQDALTDYEEQILAIIGQQAGTTTGGDPIDADTEGTDGAEGTEGTDSDTTQSEAPSADAGA